MPASPTPATITHHKKGGHGEMKLPLYQLIARAGDAANNCAAQGNREWQQVWEELLAKCEELLPSGSGFDSGTKIEYASSSKIVLQTSYHHMNEYGYYDGWTEHTVTVIPNLVHGFDLRISGRNRNDVKEYIADVFCDALRSEVVWDGEKVERVE